MTIHQGANDDAVAAVVVSSVEPMTPAPGNQALHATVVNFLFPPWRCYHHHLLSDLSSFTTLLASSDFLVFTWLLSIQHMLLAAAGSWTNAFRTHGT
jgi:hypothetical protein